MTVRALLSQVAFIHVCVTHASRKNTIHMIIYRHTYAMYMYVYTHLAQNVEAASAKQQVPRVVCVHVSESTSAPSVSGAASESFRNVPALAYGLHIPDLDPQSM